MATVDQLKAQRDSLKSAMRSGALNVKHGDKSVTYRSLSELRSALDDLESEIAIEEGRKRRRVTYIRAGRGY